MPLEELRHRLIVSCQSSEGDAFHDAENMARFARAAVKGGAAGIRANSPGDVLAIRGAVSVPIVGIQKRTMPDGRVLITPSLDDARALVAAGASAVALDCTVRGQSYGALKRIRQIRDELRVPVFADIATTDEAIRAANAGADFVLSTMRGYTPETALVNEFDPAFIAALAEAAEVPVIAEGRIWTQEHVRAAFEAGAFAVIIGSAITRPHEITRHLIEAIPSVRPVIGIDLGASRIKYAIVSASGTTSSASTAPTDTRSRESVLAQLCDIARRLHGIEPRASAIGVATAGWPDPATGRIMHATPNLPDWIGAPVGETLAAATGLAVFVENDARAATVAEHRYGAAKQARDFACITLGTGVGGGCFANGRLVSGAHSLANAIGHIVVEPGGRECNCGRSGCLEAYVKAGEIFPYLTRACEFVTTLLDPELIVLTGGRIESDPAIVTRLRGELGTPVKRSPLGNLSGVIGAAALCASLISPAARGGSTRAPNPPPVPEERQL